MSLNTLLNAAKCWVSSTFATQDDVDKTVREIVADSGADWNANDGDLGYIKNKPFGISYGYSTLVDEIVTTSKSYASNTYSDGEIGAMLDNDPDKVIKAGDICTVVFDGVEYECVAYEVDPNASYGYRAVLGNLKIQNSSYDGGHDNGEPFVFYYWYNDWRFVTVDSGTYSVIIKKLGDIYNPIDERFLPAVIGRPGSSLGAEFFNSESNVASGSYSHAEGVNTTASGNGSHTEGDNTTASGNVSHSEGWYTTASGGASHAEGGSTDATGEYSHAEGSYTEASGEDSHAENSRTTASGDGSHAEGYSTTAASRYQHVQGMYNRVDSENVYAHIVGNGLNMGGVSNAHTLDWNGNSWYAGTVYVGGASQEDAEEVATKTFATNPKDYFALNDVETDRTYIIQMKNGVLVNRCAVASINVTTMPTKVDYIAGEHFDPTGMIVTGICQDGTSVEIKNYTYEDTYLKTGNNIITISYIECNIVHTTTLNVTATDYDAASALADFTYTANNDGTYTLTGWNKTLNGASSTKLVIPNNGLIRL